MSAAGSSSVPQRWHEGGALARSLPPLNCEDCLVELATCKVMLHMRLACAGDVFVHVCSVSIAPSISALLLIEAMRLKKKHWNPLMQPHGSKSVGRAGRAGQANRQGRSRAAGMAGIVGKAGRGLQGRQGTRTFSFEGHGNNECKNAMFPTT